MMATSHNRTGFGLLRSLLLSILFSTAAAASNTSTTTTNSTTGAVFVYNSSTTGTSLVFALNADAETNDLYVHMAAPAGNSWLGIGFGNEMTNTRMLIAYANSNGTGVTLSPRLAMGHSEPVFDPEVSCDLIWDPKLLWANSVSTYGEYSNEGYLTVDAVCRNATKWSKGELKLGMNGNFAQPMIFAVGSSWSLRSDNKDASLKRHSFYGHFTMDMQAATTSNASVPVPNGLNGNYTTLHASANAIDVHKDNNPIPFLHGFGMCVIFALIFPFGSLVLRIFNAVRLHAAVQIFGYLLLVLAMAGGVYVSKQYNRSKGFNSPHQVLGIIVVIAVSAQLGFGIVNHTLVRRRPQDPTSPGQRTLLAKVHLVLGPGAIVLGVVNGGLGWAFAQNSSLAKRYAVVIVAIAVLFIAIRVTVYFCTKRRREVKQDDAIELTGGGPEGYQYPQFVAPPPPYLTGSPQGMPSYQAPPVYKQQYVYQQHEYQ